MHPLRLISAVCLTMAVTNFVAADDAIPPISGIGPTGPLTVVHEGFKFTEGPAADAEGRLYFTDVFANRIHIANPGGAVETFLESSGGMNGLMFAPNGKLYGCQGAEGRIVAIDVGSKDVQVIADKYNDIRFNRPNDLVVDTHGGVYFTDPKIAGAGKQDKAAFYYASADGTVTRLGDNVLFPNGILLSPDEKTLYVLPYGSPDVLSYAVESPGKVGPAKVLCRLVQKKEDGKSGGDGLTVDTKGNLYLTAPAVKAIQVVSPEGETLGLLELPKSPSNCDFGGADRKTLFITAGSILYSLPMEAVGHRVGAAHE